MIKNDIATAIEKKSDFNRAKSLFLVESILNSLKDALANDRFLTRDHRPVIAVNENYRRWIPGVVLDRSRSGNTLFIRLATQQGLSDGPGKVTFPDARQTADEVGMVQPVVRPGLQETLPGGRVPGQEFKTAHGCVSRKSASTCSICRCTSSNDWEASTTRKRPGSAAARSR